MLCYFLLYNEENQPYIFIYPPPLDLPLRVPPPTHPFGSSQSTELSFLCFIAGSH